MHPKQSDWDNFYGKMKKASGLDLYQYKAGQLQRRILSMAETKRVKSLDEFWTHISNEKDGITWFMDRLAINVSELYRNPEKWEEMRTKILPELLKKRSRIKAWSAGCSIGAEAHSLATLFANDFPGGHTILGTDIDMEALAQAKSGTYKDSEMRAVPPQIRSKYFDKTGDTYVANEQIKKYLTFRKGNLLADRFDLGFDLIMCRNVVIYFTDEAKDELYAKFYRALAPGGYLFVGSTERIHNYSDIGFESSTPFFYQKPLHEEKKWQIAS